MKTPPGTSARSTMSSASHGVSMSRMIRSKPVSAALRHVTDVQVPGRVRAAEERLDVAPGDRREVVAQLVRVQLAAGADGPQQRAGQRARAGAGLEHLGAREDVAHGDDLRRVLRVDHLRAARHGQHVVGEQRAQRQVRRAAGWR